MSSSAAAQAELRLGLEEREALAGVRGAGERLAAQLIVALGRIYGAADLVPVASVQVAGVSYRNLGRAGLDFLCDWADKGAQAHVTSLLNPAGMDLIAWRDHGIPEEFARQQLAVVEAYRRLGVAASCTCTPYLVGHVPQYGQHLAWSESSAVVFVNSILGARTNREGGPGALAAAILGKTARYGLHLDEERRATVVVDVTCPVHTPADFGALGYLVGRLAGDRVPLLRLLAGPPGLEGAPDLLASPYLPHVKALGAAMGASGAVALYHIAGVTPESRRRDDLVAEGAERVPLKDLRAGFGALDSGGPEVDVVSIGCPHASLPEMAHVAQLLRGRRVRAELWITTARPILAEARERGLAQELEGAGARLMADTCLVVAPMASYGFRVLATNSAKMATYAPAHCGLATHFGPLETCISAALSGRWEA